MKLEFVRSIPPPLLWRGSFFFVVRYIDAQKVFRYVRVPFLRRDAFAFPVSPPASSWLPLIWKNRSAWTLRLAFVMSCRFAFVQVVDFASLVLPVVRVRFRIYFDALQFAIFPEVVSASRYAAGVGTPWTQHSISWVEHFRMFVPHYFFQFVFQVF
jgi:hypothetical protein